MSGKILVHISEHRRELRQSFDTGIPGLFVASAPVGALKKSILLYPFPGLHYLLRYVAAADLRNQCIGVVRWAPQVAAVVSACWARPEAAPKMVASVRKASPSRAPTSIKLRKEPKVTFLESLNTFLFMLLSCAKWKQAHYFSRPGEVIEHFLHALSRF